MTRILVIQGTVREGRKSVMAARKLEELFRDEDVEAELYDPEEKDIPHLRNRRYTDGETDPEIEEFGQKVENSDGLVIVSPEYNHSVPGVLKNLLDHLYPEYDSKPFAYVTVSAGGFGGIRCLGHLQDITLALNAVPGPHLPVSNVGELFDEEGNLAEKAEEDFTDFVEKTIRHVEENS